MSEQDKPILTPFNRPCFVGKELVYIAEAVGSGRISGNGPFSVRCQEFLEQRLGIPKVFLSTSCTDALEMSAQLLNIEDGDEVIVPSYTFVSTPNAYVLHGAKPVFVDIRPDTLNMDETQLEALITPRTKAIVPVHYAGVACEMDTILKVAGKHGVAVVEDNAHGLLGKYKGRFLGTFGCMATQSFHETKNVTCGEGGALLINDEGFIDRAEVVREKGTDRSRFFRGQIDKYSWIDVGSSYLPSDVLAAFLYAQLEAIDRIQEQRQRIWEYYFKHLQEWATSIGAKLPIVPVECDQSYHMFYILMPSLEARQALIAALKKEKIDAVFHYLPLHSSPMGRKFGGKEGECPVTEDVSARLVRLPFFNDISTSDQDYIITTCMRSTAS